MRKKMVNEDWLTELLDSDDPTARVVIACLRERASQNVKWGIQDHDPFVWLAVIGEEFGESCEALLHFRVAWVLQQVTGKDDDAGRLAQLEAHAREELVQTAASAMAAVEALDRGDWEWGQVTVNSAKKAGWNIAYKQGLMEAEGNDAKDRTGMVGGTPGVLPDSGHGWSVEDNTLF
jgi:hypothetical protein